MLNRQTGRHARGRAGAHTHASGTHADRQTRTQTHTHRQARTQTDRENISAFFGSGISDMVVGAYLSDTAVVMFGQPIVSLDAELKVLNTTSRSSIDYIEQDGSRTELQICFHYNHRSCSAMGNVFKPCNANVLTFNVKPVLLTPYFPQDLSV